MDKIQVLDKHFKMYIPESEIQEIVRRLAAEIAHDFKGKRPLLCPILTGSFMFAADLIRELDLDSKVAFVRYASYMGLQSTGQVQELMGFPGDCRGRDVIIIEDIIDTGISMEYMLQQLQNLKPASISICAFLYKPNSFRKNYKIDYIGKSIPNDFIVGYGLDYDGMGRTYRDIYVLDE